jgi:S-DNA-T family DNA segregation ATPase FtsK/SpoIIIE
LALGVYGSSAGLLSSGLHRAGGLVLGTGEDTVPVVLVLGGASLLTHRARRGVAGALAAAIVFAIAASGLSDLLGGRPGLHAGSHALENAGGYVGSVLGTGLHRLVGGPGGAIILLALCASAAAGLVGVTLRMSAIAIGRTLSLLGVAAHHALQTRERPPRRAPAASAAPLTSTVVPRHGPIDDAASFEPDLAADAGGSAEDALPLTPAAAVALVDPAADELAADDEAEIVPIRAEQLGLGIVPSPGPWRLPQSKLLGRSTEQGTDRREVEARGKVLEAALRSHGVDTTLVGSTVGPTVTRFELELAAGVKVARVTSLAKDIAYAMASPDVRILAPIPGRSAIGVEVPNATRQLVTLGDVLASPEARRAQHPLEVALGRDIAGRAVMANLAEMPHLLIAGATGAGKSSCINSLLTSILMRSTPEEVRLILVDPKRVELGQYNGLPHLLTAVVVNPKRAANALAWAVAEMERRYDLLAEAGMRDITGYNAAVDRGDFAPGPFDPGLTGVVVADDLVELDELPDDAFADEAADAADEGDGATVAPSPGADAEAVPDGGPDAVAGADPRFARLPFILIVVDELNDLMMVAARDVEESICRIAQMARAVGIHLVIATQRPSVDVITGVIKANIPSRLAFSVSSLADSRVILDQPGAERLVGRGDLLLLTASSSVARRIQSPWVAEEEVHSVVGHWRRQSGSLYVDGIVGEDGVTPGAGGADESDDDVLLAQAMELVVRSQLGSTSMLQRKLRVGFSRAGRLMDLLERRGIVGPSEGSKARAVLMTPDELDGISR